MPTFNQSDHMNDFLSRIGFGIEYVFPVAYSYIYGCMIDFSGGSAYEQMVASCYAHRPDLLSSFRAAVTGWIWKMLHFPC